MTRQLLIAGGAFMLFACGDNLHPAGGDIAADASGADSSVCIDAAIVNEPDAMKPEPDAAEPECDLYDDVDCKDGATCKRSNQTGTPICVLNLDDRPYGAECQLSGECADGMGCLNDACAYFCTIGEQECKEMPCVDGYCQDIEG